MWLRFQKVLSPAQKTLCRSLCVSQGHRNADNSASGLCFELSDEQREMQLMARKFGREKVMPVAAEYDRKAEMPMHLMKEEWELGMVNCLIPKKYGGLELGLFINVILVEEVGYGDNGTSQPMVVNTLAEVPLIMGGSENICKKYLGRMIEEPLMASYAVTEPNAGSDVSGIQAKAVKKGNEYVLNGSKMFISNASYANWLFVLAKTDPEPSDKGVKGFTGFVVEADWPGVTIGPKLNNLGIKTADCNPVTFEDVIIPKENVVGTEGKGFELAMKSFDRTRPLTSAAAVGLAWRALDEATKYSLERKTFGKPICEHQAIAHMLAEMEVRLQAARWSVWQSAWMVDNGKRNTKMASIGKYLAAEAAMHNALDAVQVFGGYGYNTEYPVEKLFRDAKVHSIFEVTSQIQKTIISRDLISQAKHGNL